MMTFAASAIEAHARPKIETSAKKSGAAKAAPARFKTAKAAKGSVKAAVKSIKAEKNDVGFPIGDIGVLKRSVGATAAKTPAGGDYHAIIQRYAKSYGVPISLAYAVVRVESNYRPNARGKAGEIGLMQIKPATARMMGYSGSAKGLFDPETNIKYGMLYLAKAHKLGGGSLCRTILKYNAGHAAKRMNPVSAAYCAKIKRLSLGL